MHEAATTKKRNAIILFITLFSKQILNGLNDYIQYQSQKKLHLERLIFLLLVFLFITLFHINPEIRFS